MSAAQRLRRPEANAMTRVLMALDIAYGRDDEAAHGAALWERLGSGDLVALGEAYDLFHTHVRAFARRLVGDDSSAEDIVQETFVALPNAIRGYRGDAPLRAFLLGVAVNHARHHIRTATRRRATLERLAVHPSGRRPATPEKDAERSELARLLARGLDGLSLDHRVAFVLCEVEERSATEAAQVLGIPEATVRTRLFYAKKKLAAWFEKAGVR